MHDTTLDCSQEELVLLIELIRTLRAPGGCPWDRKQSARDIGKYLLDEAYETIDALDENDPAHLCEELGDLLFQILFIAEISQEQGLFSLTNVMSGIRAKMIRRHPHVFGDAMVKSADEVLANWQEIKKQERGASPGDDIFRHIPRALPALTRARKITAQAARYGFDWPDTQGVMEKLEEELREYTAARDGGDPETMEEEFGDILFTLVNLSRFIRVDAEHALNRSTTKFLKRFAYITDQLAARGVSLEDAPLAEMDALWDASKRLKV